VRSWDAFSPHHSDGYPFISSNLELLLQRLDAGFVLLHFRLVLALRHVHLIEHLLEFRLQTCINILKFRPITHRWAYHLSLLSALLLENERQFEFLIKGCKALNFGVLLKIRDRKCEFFESFLERNIAKLLFLL
jgi:hypothetical protein